MRVRREAVFLLGGSVLGRTGRGITVRARALAAVIAGFSLVLVALGGFVRGTDAGLSCPDWPLCYGMIVPDEFKPGVLQEVSHRYLASLVSFGIVLFAFLAYPQRREFPRLWTASRVTVLLLLSQVLLGGLTVLLKLNPFIVTAHLALGSAIFQTYAVMATDRRPRSAYSDGGVLPVARESSGGVTRSARKIQRLASWMKAFAYLVAIQILLGGFVGSSGAALACPDIPLCFGHLLPPEYGPQQLLHMAHRIVALCLLVMALVSPLLAFGALRTSGGRVRAGRRAGGSAERSHMRVFLVILFMVILQVGLGLSNVYWMVPVSVAVLHLVVAQGILLASIRAYRMLVPEISLYATRDDLDNRSGDESMHYPMKRRFVANY